jgi:ActR/RegA family two-component response regulator
MIYMKSNVVLIDDEKDFCMALKGQFARRHLQLECANTIGEGIECVRSLHPDVVLLDNELPDGQGWRQAGKMQKEFPNMRIILISALDPLGPEETGIGLQFTRLAKPVNINQLEEYLS